MTNVITVWGNTSSSPSSAAYSQPSGGGIYPPNQLPGSGNGGGGTGSGPGGIGVGDGGFDTPSNPLFGIPIITFPSSVDNENIEEGDTVTSSVFDDGGTSATHEASRWMLLYLGAAGDSPNLNSPVILYDSGVELTNLIALPLTVLELDHDSLYAVRVRYKGSDNTWSRWSADQTFTSYSCPADTELRLNIDFSETTGYEATGTTITQVNNLGTLTAWAATLSDGVEAEIETVEFLNPSAEFVASGGTYLSGTSASGAVDSTIFIVGKLGAPGVDAFVGLTVQQDVYSYALGDIDWIGVKMGAANTGSISFSSTANVANPGWESADNTISVGERFLVEIAVRPAIDGESYIFLNGVQIHTDTVDWAIATPAFLEAFTASPVTETVAWIGEIRQYDVYLTATEREAVRVQLAAKWGVPLSGTPGVV